MNEEQRIKLMEEELKILKNEVKTILLDIREQYLNIQNPFNINMVANTPPAGANPDQKEKVVEPPIEEFDLAGDTALASADNDLADAGLSFGKPFADLSDKPGMAPAGFGNDVPGADPSFDGGPSFGPGPSAGMPGSEDLTCEDEDEQPQKSKNSRGKKKEEEIEDEDSDEDDDIFKNTKPVTPKNGKNKKKSPSIVISGTRADLVVIAGLTQWVDHATGKLGKDRTEALVEMSNAMGRIPDNIKDVLIRMVRISRYESSSEQSPTATDYLATLAQLESLMDGGEQMKDNQLLSILSMMKESNRG